jgi:hypothetical protein
LVRLKRVARPFVGSCHALAVTTLGSAMLCGVSACRENQRIGDRVLVAYEGMHCPGYVVDKKSDTRFRIHFSFEGYAWEDDVPADHVLARAVEPTADCPLPERVRTTLGLLAAPKTAPRTSPYQVGERVRVRWRGSVYPATILRVLAPDSVLVHYQGYEDAWDETISTDRIETARR